MELQVNSWGNSLGFRLPKAIAEMLGVKRGSTVEAVMENGRLIIFAKPPTPAPDMEFFRAVEATLEEWDSPEDDDAFKNL